jgi:predicted phage terminase large subunit-like protein
MTEINVAEVQEKLDKRDKARTDKLFLATGVLGYQFQEDVHSALFANYIAYDKSKPWREQSDIKDRLILWPRGFFKSTSIIVEIVQAILNFPDIRILIMQGSLPVTQNLLAEIKSHFTGIAPDSKLRELFPEFCADVLGTKSAFTTPARVQLRLQQATVTVASPKSVKTGQHFDVLFADDLVNDQNYQSAKKLEKVAKEFRAMIPLVDPGGYRFVTGTRYAFGDLYEQIIRANDNKQWTISEKDCWLEDRVTPRFNQRTLPDGRIVGITREQLLQIMREDPKMFASQYLNKPASTGNQIFTEERVLGAVVTEQSSPVLSQAVLFIDLAASQQEGGDDSVILCGKTDHLSNTYIVDGIGGQWTTPVLAAQVIQMALKHRPLRIMIEKTAAAVYFVEYLKLLCQHQGLTLPLDFIKINNTKDAKFVRISSLDGHLRTKRLRFFVGLQCWDKMLEQFTQFPGRHDDYPDTVALAVQSFGGQLSAVAPQTSSKHPILIRMEEQERRNEQHGFIKPQQEFVPDSMGSDFE